ncbi:ABC transporter permease [Amycolatopsis sp. K13G38]|uniref:ABC transporter permease n=1 Tax=Amycolatopsis acididurans TaxID=2724524 RepID=A0ABX1J9W4_9PSEU|nr:ABC transporter permease [Amycolatopsis acididurans]NKQ56081.1 ABC transporter permease [Amycolatopsis acididurans]
MGQIALDTLVTGLPMITGIAGIYLLFRILNDFDLTVDGSFTLGAAVSAVTALNGVPAVPAVLLGVIAGALSGLLTASLHVAFKIPILLAGLVMSMGLFSINLRVMNVPTLSLLGDSGIFAPFADLDGPAADLAVAGTLLAIDAVVLGVLLVFLRTEIGLAIRATGVNPVMATAQGVSRTVVVAIALAIANGLTALAGALTVQVQGFVDVNAGTGTLIAGAGAVLLGELLLRPTPSKVGRAMIAVLVGGVAYRLIIVLALRLGLAATDLKLVTAVTLILAVGAQLAGRGISERLTELGRRARRGPSPDDAAPQLTRAS